MPSAQTTDQVDPAVLKWLQLWHQRMAHATLRQITAMGKGAVTGVDPPANLPDIEGPGLDPYYKAFKCDTCLEVYGQASGPRDDQVL